MRALPNHTVPLADQSGMPTKALLGILPTLHATAPVVDSNGLPTETFRLFLQDQGAVLRNVAEPLTLKDGTPTRSMVMLLANLP